MSRHVKFGWALAFASWALMGFVAYMDGGMDGINGYAFGLLFGATWMWTLKGVK